MERRNVAKRPRGTATGASAARPLATPPIADAAPDADGELPGLVNDERMREVGGLQSLLESMFDAASSDETEEEAPPEGATGGERAGQVVAPPPPDAHRASSSSSSPGPRASGSEDLRSLRRSCLQQCAGWSCPHVCEALSVELVPNPWRLVHEGPPTAGWDVEGATLGTLCVTFGGNTLQALCGNPSHRPSPCKLMLNVKGDWPGTEARLVRWLVSGVAASRDEHMSARKILRDEQKAVK